MSIANMLPENPQIGRVNLPCQPNQDVTQNEAAVAAFNDYIQDITNLHIGTPEEVDWNEIHARQAPFQPGEMGPYEKEAREAYQTYEPHFLARIVKPLADRKRKQLKTTIQEAKEQDTADYEEWETTHYLADRVLKGEADAYRQAMQNSPVFEEIIQRGISIGVPESGDVEAEIRVDSKDVVPNKRLTLTKTGKISRRKMNKTDYHRIMKEFVCSYTLWVAQSLFAVLPVSSCTLHVTEKTLDTATGHRKNKVLLSVHIDRQTLGGLHIENINSADALENFDHHIDHLKTKGFRPVKRLAAK